MSEYEIAVLADRLTGIVAACFASGLILGYVRVLLDESALVRHISYSTVLMALACATETLRVRDTGSVDVQIVGIIFNITVIYAHYRGLKAVHRMIPDDDRSDYEWYTAPLYPPWGWPAGINRFMQRWRYHFKQSDRRKEHKDIPFPDRRRPK